jgi:hypothetical protein
MVKRAWTRLTRSGVLWSIAGLAGLACLVAAAWSAHPIAGLAALGVALLFVSIGAPDSRSQP